MQTELEAFFDAYRDSFPHGPTAIAEFYFEPCITARMGAVRVNPSHKEASELFAKVDAQYRARGYTHAEYVPLDLRAFGTNSALATIRWSYRGADGATIWQTTFSYNLYRRDGAWKILLQTMHDE